MKFIIFTLLSVLSYNTFSGNCSSKNNQETKIELLANKIEEILIYTKFYEIEKRETELKLKHVFCPQIKQLESYCELFGNNCHVAEKIIHHQIRQRRKIGHIRNLKHTLNKIIKKEIHGKITY